MKFSRIIKSRHDIGMQHHFIIEDHGGMGFMAQHTYGPKLDVNSLRTKTLVLDHFPTVHAACDAMGMPYELLTF